MVRTRLIAALLTLALIVVPIMAASAGGNASDAAPGVSSSEKGKAADQKYILLQLNNRHALVDGQSVSLKNGAGETCAPYYYGGVSMLPLRLLAELFGCTVGWDQAAQSITVTGDKLTVSFKNDSAVAQVNGAPVYLTAPVLTKDGTVYMGARDFCGIARLYLHFYDKTNGEYLLISNYPVTEGDAKGDKDGDFQKHSSDSTLLSFKSLGSSYLGPSQTMYAGVSLFLRSGTTHALLRGNETEITATGATQVAPITGPDGTLYVPLEYCALSFGMAMGATDDGYLAASTDTATAAFPIVSGYYIQSGEQKWDSSYGTIKFDNIVYTTPAAFAAAAGLYYSYLDDKTVVFSKADYTKYDTLQQYNDQALALLQGAPTFAGYLAMTFDDGPSSRNTAGLLDRLAERGVHATFFLVRSSMNANASLMSRYAAEGHQLGNHSATHPDMTKLSTSAVDKELDSTGDTIRYYTGVTPVVFRPPGGAYTRGVLSELSARGLSCILWTIDPKDWYYLNTQTVTNNILSSAGDGSIVLLHDTHGTSVEAGLSVIDTMRDRGYKFLTVSDLAFIKGQTLNPGGVYSRLR